MKIKSLIYISYYFPPIHSIASLRNYHLVKNIASKVESLKVLTTSNQRIFPKDIKSLEGINVSILPTFDYRTILFLIKREKTKIHFDESEKKNKVIKTLLKLNETLPLNLLFGEGGVFFIISSVWSSLRLLSKNQKSMIITPYRPTANIFAGYIIKLFLNKIFWVVSMHDIPIIYNRLNCYFPKIQKKIWTHMLSKADKVITLSHGLSRDLTSYNIHAAVVENGIILREPISAENEKFTISYTGSLYDGLFHPIDLFHSMEQLLEKNIIEKQKISIIYAGKDSKKWKDYCKDFPLTHSILCCYDNLPHSVALSLQESANINVLLSWSSNEVQGILTGKVFEYLGARNPIMALISGSYDSSFEYIFEKFNCGQIFYSSDENRKLKIENFVLEMFQSWLNGNFTTMYNPTEPILDQSWEIQADKYWNLINS